VSPVTRRQYRLRSWRAPVQARMSLAVDAEALMRLVHDVCKNAGMTTVVVTHDAQPRPRRTG
jgi:hypothetical protein